MQRPFHSRALLMAAMFSALFCAPYLPAQTTPPPVVGTNAALPPRLIGKRIWDERPATAIVRAFASEYARPSNRTA